MILLYFENLIICHLKNLKRIFILKYMDKLVRTTKHILKFANKEKLSLLDDLYTDYEVALKECIDLLYEEKLPLKNLLSSKLLPKSFGNISHSRWRQLIYKHASEIIRGTIAIQEKQRKQRYKKVYKYFLKRNRQTKFLEKHYHELNLKKYKKPEIMNIGIILDERFLNEQHGNFFDLFLKIFTPYFYENKRRSITLNIPIKLTKLDNKYKNWNRRKSMLLKKINGNYYINFIYETILPENRKDGIAIGLDFGIKKLLTTSRGEFLGTEIESICNEITNCKRGSKHYQSLLEKRNQYIDKVIKNLDVSNVNKIIIENLKDLKGNSRKNGKSTREFRNRFQYCSVVRTVNNIEKLCMEQGIELVKVSPSYTSQTCSRCKSIDKASRQGENYHCSTCGMEMDADLNGALNILQRGVYSPSCIEKKF